MGDTHSKWALLPTEEISRYIREYQDANAPGKTSARRRKKIRYFQSLLRKRDQAERLILGR